MRNINNLLRYFLRGVVSFFFYYTWTLAMFRKLERQMKVEEQRVLMNHRTNDKFVMRGQILKYGINYVYLYILASRRVFHIVF